MSYLAIVSPTNYSQSHRREWAGATITRTSTAFPHLAELHGWRLPGRI